MVKIKINRYPQPDNVDGWAGWIEPEDRSWILYFADDGRTRFYPHRDPETGGIIEIGDIVPTPALGGYRHPDSKRPFVGALVRLARARAVSLVELPPAEDWPEHWQQGAREAVCAVYDMVRDAFAEHEQPEGLRRLMDDLTDALIDRVERRSAAVIGSRRRRSRQSLRQLHRCPRIGAGAATRDSRSVEPCKRFTTCPETGDRN